MVADKLSASRGAHENAMRPAAHRCRRL